MTNHVPSLTLRQLLCVKRNVLKLDAFASRWADNQRFVYGYTRHFEYALALDMIFQRSQARVLDIGSGFSIFPLYLASHGHTVIQSDYDTIFLRQQEDLRQTPFAALLGRTLHFAVLDARHLPAADGSMDFVTFISSIEHVPAGYDRQMMAEIARVLKPGGRALVTTEVSDRDSQFFMEMPGHFGYQYTAEFARHEVIPFKVNYLDPDEVPKKGDSIACQRSYSFAGMMALLPAGTRCVAAGFYGECRPLRCRYWWETRPWTRRWASALSVMCSWPIKPRWFRPWWSEAPTGYLLLEKL